MRRNLLEEETEIELIDGKIFYKGADLEIESDGEDRAEIKDREEDEIEMVEKSIAAQNREPSPVQPEVAQENTGLSRSDEIELDIEGMKATIKSIKFLKLNTSKFKLSESMISEQNKNTLKTGKTYREGNVSDNNTEVFVNIVALKDKLDKLMTFTEGIVKDNNTRMNTITGRVSKLESKVEELIKSNKVTELREGIERTFGEFEERLQYLEEQVNESYNMNDTEYWKKGLQTD